MDPVSQILAQSQGGSASGQGFGQFFAEGVQSGQRQQQLNLATRRQQFEEQQQSADEQRRSMLFPLQMEAARINNTKAGLNLQNQFAAQNKLVDLLDLQRRFSIAPNGYSDTELIDAVNTVFKQAPTLTEHPVGKEILGSIAAAPKLDASFGRIKQLNDQLKGSGLYVQRLDERGRPVLGELNQPRAGTLPGQASPIGKLVADYNALRASGDVEGTQFAKAALIKAGQANGLNLEFSDDGRLTSLTQGTIPEGGKIPASVIARAEEAANTAPAFIRTGRDIINLGVPGNVGIEGNIKRIGKELAGQFMDIEAGDEFDFAQATTFFKGQATKVLRSDSQISEPERKSIVADLPSKGWLEADETARRKAKGAIRRVAESARRQIIRAGRLLPAELMTPDEIIADVQAGKLTKQQAEEALQLLRTYE